MRLPQGGIDVCYIDESTDRDLLVMVAVSIPFLRQIDGTWTIVWPDQFNNVRDWRRQLSTDFSIPVQKELKGSKLAAGRGRYLKGQHQLQRGAAATAYRAALGMLDFLPPRSVITVVASPSAKLYGHGRLEAPLYALLQRLQKAASANRRAGIIFFDEGHGEYRKLYRKALVHLPTGSNRGDWGGGVASKSMPLENFVKDGNIKNSQHCFYTQLADIISYAALLKVRAERHTLTPWQQHYQLGSLYDAIPDRVLNELASSKDPKGIVRLGP